MKQPNNFFGESVIKKINDLKRDKETMERIKKIKFEAEIDYKYHTPDGKSLFSANHTWVNEKCVLINN